MSSDGTIRIPNDEEERLMIEAAERSKDRREESKRKREMLELVEAAGEYSKNRREKTSQSTYQ